MSVPSTSYLVSLNVETSIGSLAEIAGILGVEADFGSHSKGELGRGKNKMRPLTNTLWRLNSGTSDDATLEEHLQAIFARIPEVLKHERGKLPPDSSISLDVAVYYSEEQTPFPTIRLCATWTEALAKIGAGIEVTLYPGQ